MIAVLDYGIGNLASAQKALVHVGGTARLIDDPDEVGEADGVVLPGVGAFGACARALRESGLHVAALKAYEAGVPFLGICVGFQLLFDASDESPNESGLGIVAGRVVKLSEHEKLPQMQWNVIDVAATSQMFPPVKRPRWFYFVHSYAPVLEDSSSIDAVATCDYGGPVVAAIERDNLWGVQFHPEKSGRDGLELLERFVARCDSAR